MDKFAAVLLGTWILAVLYLLSTVDSDAKKHVIDRSMENVILDTADSVKLEQDDPEDIVHVGLTCDNNTIMGTMAAINSIYQNTYYVVVFHILAEKNIVDDLSFWIKNTQLQDIRHDIKVFDNSRLAGKIKVRGGRQELANPMNYARFFYPEYFPKVDRIIHVDNDVIVQGDIMQLYNIKLKPDQLAAFSEDCTSGVKKIANFQTKYVNYLNFQNEAVRKLKLHPGTCSFNTGVFVADLNKWRKESITKKLLYWTELNTRENVYGNENRGGGSQPPMMIVFYRRHTGIEPLWHVQHLGEALGSPYSRDFLKKAKLLHWSGRFKPWKFQATHSSLWEDFYVDDPKEKHKILRQKHPTADKPF